MIEALDFRCSYDGCGKETSYSNAMNHSQNCDKKPLPCTQNCGRFCKPELMELHHLKECENSIFICEVCNTKTKVKELSNQGLENEQCCIKHTSVLEKSNSNFILLE